MSTRGYKGPFTPKNPQKYIGDPTKITYRSLLERSCMVKFDTQPNIVRWASEEVVIKYVSPIDNRVHRYFVDFYVEYYDANGNLIKELIEVKPYSQIKEPVKRKRQRHETYAIAVATYQINRAKWAAAQKFCEGTDVTFKLLTEKQIRSNKRDK